jgi:putative transposase
MWQTDFTQLQVVSWGWYYLCTVWMTSRATFWGLAPGADHGRHDVQDTLQLALDLTGVEQVQVTHRPRLLSDNGPAFIADALADYLKPYHIAQVHGRAHHPQTQGKIERYHRSTKSIVKLNTFFFPWELEQAIADFVAYYDTQRYPESLDTVTPADVYLGRQQEVLTQREMIKQRTLLERRRYNLHIEE